MKSEGFYAKHEDQDDLTYDPEDIARGSYGIDVDKYLGRSPIDGPPGYVFQKVTYSSQGVAGGSNTNIAGVYKLCTDHNGYIYHSDGSSGGSSEVLINQDGADSGVDPDKLASMGEAKLVSGDRILGAILQLIDTRNSDNRTGMVTAGLVSNESAVPDTYGRDIARDPGNFVGGSAISGARTSAANGLVACAVASPNLNIYSPSKVAVETNDLGETDIGAPINAISISGINGSQANQIRFTLNVYALVGPRQKTISHYTQPDPSFRLECLTKKFCKHPVSMLY
jgi:hypothetical protein